jgi:hypothetical protein
MPNTKSFTDEQTGAELKINCIVGANFVGFQIGDDENTVILTRSQIINEVLPLLGKVK